MQPDMWRRARFVWGKTDCMTATCDYIRDMTGIDPARPWRGTYGTESEAQALFAGYGGVLGMARHAMALAGFHEAPEPLYGLPVVCDFGGVEVAGVHIGPLTAFMAMRGRVDTRARVLACWDI